MLTTALIAAALLVALTLPDASSSLFALTGATGVCAIGYAFPIFAYWRLPPEYGGVNTPQVDYLVSRTTSEPYNPLATPPPSRHGRPQWLQSLTSFPFFTSQHHLSPRSAVNAYGPASDPEVTLLSRIRNLLLARVWPTSVLLLGSIVSLMTLLVVFTKLQDGETRCEALKVRALEMATRTHARTHTHALLNARNAPHNGRIGHTHPRGNARVY